MLSTRTLTALLAACVALAAGASTASAGKYRHLACPGTVADGQIGWQAVGNNYPSTHATNNCGSTGWLMADITIAAGYPVGSQEAGWQYRAPAGTKINGFHGNLAGWIEPWDNYNEGAIITRDDRGDLQWFEDRNGHNALLNDVSRPLAIGYRNLSSDTVSVNAVCARGGTAPVYDCSAYSPVWLGFKDAVVELSDPYAPASGPPTGALVTDAKLTGTRSVSAALTDQGSGVRYMVVKADGAEIARSQVAGGSCTATAADNGYGVGYTAPVPCPNSVSGSVAVNTATIADGTHTITVTVVDAAGNSTIVYEADKTIANIAPTNTTPPSFRDPVAAASPRPGTALDVERGSWDGPNLTYSPQWQRCDQDGSTCVDIPGATGTRYTPTSADSGFRLRLVVTAVNVAGSLSKTTTLSGVVAAPEQSAKATSQIKTPDLGGASVDGRGVLNGSVIGSDTGSCSKDQYVLRATRYKGKVVRLRYGSKVAIRVKLTCQTGGYAISGAKLQTATLIPGQTQSVGGEVVTDKKGEAIIRAGKGPSRGITIGYRHYTGDDALRAELRLRVAVRGRISLTVRQGLGGIATFRGQVTGGYIPTRGVTVQLQFLDPRDGWRPVKNMVTDNRGRYSYRYQFKQPVSFKFRAVVAPGQTDYPFMLAHSKTRIGHG